MRYEPDRCRLQTLYNETGINQRTLHILTGIPESQLSDYANNRTRMGLGVAVTIARAMNLPTPEVIYTWKVFKK